MAEILKPLRNAALATLFAAGGLGAPRPVAAGEFDSQAALAGTRLPDPTRRESGNHWLKFKKGDPVLGGIVVTDGVNRRNWRYNCYDPSAPRDGVLRYGVVNYSGADKRAARENGAKNCDNVDPRPGPRKETGDGESLLVRSRDYAYGYAFIDSDDGEYRYNVKVIGGKHPEGRVISGVRNQPPGETDMPGYSSANPRTGPREETGAGGQLSFGPGAEAYGFNVIFEDGSECNPADENGSRTGPGCEIVNAPMPGVVESGVVNPPPAEMDAVDLPVWP